MSHKNYLATTLLAFLLAVFAASPAFSLFEGVDEEAIGRNGDRQIIKMFGLYNDEKVQEYVRDVANRVLGNVNDREFMYQFKVVDTEMVNAFALPGGYIYVTRGLLAVLNSEAALAGVIGHEIGHVIGHHSVRMMKQNIGQLLLALGGLAASDEIRKNAGAWLTVTTSLSQQIIAGYGREMEMESDQVGMMLAHETGYDPDGIVSFLQSMRMLERLGAHGYHGFQASHPDTVMRIIEAEGKSGLLKARGDDNKKYEDRYMAAIEGLAYGKPKWRGRTLPPFKIHIHTVQEGESLRSLAETVSGDAGMAIEMAALNGMKHNDTIKPGQKIKVLVKEDTPNKGLLKSRKEKKKDEIGEGIGDGKDEKPGQLTEAR